MALGALSPFHAQYKCAILHASPPTNFKAARDCANARAIQGVLLGCALSVGLLVYRGSQIKRYETWVAQGQSGASPPAPLDLRLAVLPFGLGVLYSLWTPASSAAQYAADNLAYTASKMTPSEWVGARANDARTSKSATTSILCAVLISGCGVYNSHYAIRMSQRARESEKKPELAERKLESAQMEGAHSVLPHSVGKRAQGTFNTTQ